jgi:SET domain-containing protein
MKIHIQKSSMHGKGIFATKDIAKGEVVFIIKGKKIKFLIDSKEQAEKAGMNWVGYSRNQWIDPIEHCVYFNHSCDPNSAIKGRLTFVAVRDIKKGEEITFDYSLNESDIFWRMKCRCGSKNCRKQIRSIQYLPSSLVKKRWQMIPKYFQDIYERFGREKFLTDREHKSSWIKFISA